MFVKTGIEDCGQLNRKGGLIMKTIARILVASLLCIATANAGNLIVNGDFDQNAPASGCAAGTTTVYGWKILAGNVDIDSAAPGCSGVSPVIGGHFIDLTGSHAEDGENDVGVLYQEIPTKVGTVYQLTFYFGGNAGWQNLPYPNDGPLKAMQLYVNSVLIQTYTVNTSGTVPIGSNPQWVLGTYTFTATSTTTVISFHSLNGTGSVADPNGMPAAASDFGPLLSGVSLVAL